MFFANGQLRMGVCVADDWAACLCLVEDLVGAQSFEGKSGSLFAALFFMSGEVLGHQVS